ncbi:MAG: hypothetical protein QOH36_2230 [Actinomycetota bacterium]|nr:hypothetical protein [Actinomycetota bacterium]
MDLSEQEVALVLRRAAELDLADDTPGPGLDLATIEESAVEAGLSRQSVRTALAELRVGVLPATAAKVQARRIRGPAMVTVRRSVPGPEAEVKARLRSYLGRELFKLRRERGAQASWARRDDMKANVRRGLDRSITKRLSLTDVRRVEVGVTPEPAPGPGTGEGGGRVLVVVQADVTRLCRDRGAWAATGGTLGALMTGGAVVLGTLVDPLLLLTAPAGVGAAAAGYGIGVRYYRTRVDAIEVALEALLDDLEGRPVISS